LLFKARKILKEGIGMEREFGEKSYNPGKFEYHVIYDGLYNAEYGNLFKRKIPGNILLSAYYTPMTVRELSIELGISSVYMEDELALLEKYDLIKSVGECKYQTNIIIFTMDYVKEWFKMLDKNYTAKVGEIIEIIKNSLPEIRQIGFRGCNIPDNNLLWSLYMLTIFKTSWNNRSKKKSRVLYQNETGTIYGADYKQEEQQYYCFGFAGYNSCGDNACTYANFNILSYDISKNHDEITNIISESKTKREAARFPVFESSAFRSDITSPPDDEYGKTLNLLKPAINKMAELFDETSEDSIKIMKSHAPKFVTENIESVIANTSLFEIMGWFGGAALNSGALQKPGSEDIVSICGYIG